MKYYGERTNKLYDTEKECLDAEFKAKEKENLEKIEKERALAVAKEKKEKEVAERKALAAEVDAARKALTEAQKNYHDKLAAFVDKYHTYHYSTSDPDEVPTLFDVFSKIFPF